MKTLTFYKNTRYAGGRSHRNITTLELVHDKDIFEAAEHYGLNIYPVEGEDFDGGVRDECGREIMDSDDYADWNDTGIGVLDFVETQIYSKSIKDIDLEEFKVLPSNLQLDQINEYFPNVTEEMFERAKSNDGLDFVFDYWASEWDEILQEINEEKGYVIAFGFTPHVEYLSDTMGNKTSKLIENAHIFETEFDAKEYLADFKDETYFDKMYITQP